MVSIPITQGSSGSSRAETDSLASVSMEGQGKRFVHLSLSLTVLSPFSPVGVSQHY
jgi:hypothetical protein